MPVLSQIDFGDETLNAARDWLAEWDMMNDADSGQAALFNAFWMKLIPLAFDEVINDAPDISGGSREMILMRNMIQGEHPLWNNPELGTNNRDEILGMALEQAWEMMVETFGVDTATWRWGALHLSHPKHTPLGQLPMGVDPKLDILAFQLADIFNRQYEVDGGLESVNNQRWDIRNGHFELDGAIVSMRMVIDFSNLDNSRFVHELGQSGDPFSPHFDDLSPLWVAGEYHPYGFTTAAVDAITSRTVTFVPAE
jgi:penicillin amidase